MSVCHNPEHKPNDEPYVIPDDDRKVTVAVDLAWGEGDIRDDWRGEYTFCSFRCLGYWAVDRALVHDGRVLKEGAA